MSEVCRPLEFLEDTIHHAAEVDRLVLCGNCIQYKWQIIQNC